MIAKFNRTMIASINNTQIVESGEDKNVSDKKSIGVPGIDTFRYIFEKAKKGNEMAAVLIDQWQKGCNPKNDKEKQIIQSINNAANKLFYIE